MDRADSDFRARAQCPPRTRVRRREEVDRWPVPRAQMVRSAAESGRRMIRIDRPRTADPLRRSGSIWVLERSAQIFENPKSQAIRLNETPPNVEGAKYQLASKDQLTPRRKQMLEH
jgi:hypothetical protein